ncbi:MAG: RnfH family protein [Betaproteobacteria bacterium]|nr:RnfH family protein [Betaproteobacteria bacterium]
MPEITVVCAAGPRQVVELRHPCPEGTTVLHVLRALAQPFGLDADALQAVLDEGRIGVWGKPAAANRLLAEGDRLEVYRPLTVDPKVARRERFVRQGAKTAGLFAKRRLGAKAGY